MRARAWPMVLAAAAFGAAALASPVEKSFDFETDKWFALDASDGPVTLHRIQLARQRGGLLSADKVLRPGSSQYAAPVEIRLEYSNSATRDWQARIRLAWLDEQGREIDGYNGSQELEEGESHQHVTIKLSTLQYGLERARKLKLSIECRPD